MTDAAFKIVNCAPAEGVNPFASVTLKVPFRFAAPVIFNCEYCVPGVAPPITMFRTSVAPCV